MVTSNSIKRSFDLVVSGALLILLSLPIALIAALVKLTSKGPVLHWSKRVGRNNSVFQMPKFRTMRVDAPQLATHLLGDVDRWMTPLGPFLRATSFDELPQLWSILVGQMSFVGPRPALFNQHDLVALRTDRGIHRLTPGLTGWAQINGRDNLSIPVKVQHDEWYLRHRSFRLDLWILLLTAVKVFRRDGVAGATNDASAGPSPNACRRSA